MQDFEGSHLVYVAAGPDPFDVITNAVKYVLVLSFMVSILEEISLVNCATHCLHITIESSQGQLYGNGENGVLSEKCLEKKEDVYNLLMI